MAKSNIDITTSPGAIGRRFAVSDSASHLLPNNKYCRAFIPAQSGTLAVYFADDETNTEVLLTVTAGLEYHLSIRQFRATNTVTVTHVVAVG